MSHLNNIQGSFLLTSPMHVSSHSDGNVTRIAKQNILIDGQRIQIPYFPSNDIRGRLRRKAANILIDHLTLDQGIRIELLSGLLCGSVSANPENNTTVEEVIRGQNNVYMGLFGGGTRLLTSGLQTHDLLPITNETVKQGLIPERFIAEGGHLPNAFDVYTNDRERNTNNPNFRHYRVDDVFTVRNVDILEKALDNPKEAISQYQQAVIEGKEKKKRSDKDDSAAKVKKTDLSNMFDWEAIIPGTELFVRIDFKDHMTDAQKGLLILSLLDLINENALGGMSRIGWGGFLADLHLTLHGDASTPLYQIDEKTQQYAVTESAEYLIESAKEEISALTIDDMWAFFENTKGES